MNLNNINLNHLRIFSEVFQTLSMTEAAERLALTQSGVSQHMKALEESLGVKLFDRVKQKLLPTTAAKTLFEDCQKGFFEIDKGLTRIVGEPKELSGSVAIGMPIEFGNNILLPLIAQFRKKYPAVYYNLNLDFANVLNEKLLNGDLDIAFVDDFKMDYQVETRKVYDEKLDLCISKDLLKKYGPVQHTKAFYESLDYVGYQKGGPMLRMWFNHHLKNANLNLNIAMHVMDVWGVARLIQCGVGAAILPEHFVLRFQKEGQKISTLPGMGKPLINTIHVAVLKTRTLSPATRALHGFLIESLLKKA